MTPPVESVTAHFVKMPDDRLRDVIERLAAVAKLDQRLLDVARRVMRDRKRVSA